VAADDDAVQLAVTWLTRLEPTAGVPSLEPASGVALLHRTTGLLGRGPVLWATEVGHRAAERIVREVPQFSAGAQAFETLRMGTESSTLLSLLALAGEADVTEVPAEALQGVTDFVRLGISMQSLLRGIRLGHAEISASFLQGCEALVDPDDQGDQVRYVSARLFDYIDGFAAALTERHAEEQARWSRSTAAARAELVTRILGAADVDTAEASRALGYELAGTHLAVHVRSIADAADTEGVRVQAVTGDVLADAGATQRLVIPVGGGRVWAWCTTAGEQRSVLSALRSADLPDDVRVLVGTPGRGLAGFRRSHREALAVSDLVQSVGLPGPVVAYEDVDLLSLLLHDRGRADEFVQRELGPLAASTEQARELRRTLLVYLEEESSPHTAALRLHVARNTVSYRVHRAEELMRRSVSDRRQQLQAALLMASVLPGTAQPGSV
jgi:DNA-binding PucR family transcriptional regulator